MCRLCGFGSDSQAGFNDAVNLDDDVEMERARVLANEGQNRHEDVLQVLLEFLWSKVTTRPKLNF